MNNCVFCQIINNELPRTIVFENDTVLALVPRDEVSKGHTLVIPKVHAQDIFDISDADLREVISVTKTLSAELVDKYGATAVNVLNASGKDAQQSVFHFHFHIVPRYPNDGLDMWIKQGLAK